MPIPEFDSHSGRQQSAADVEALYHAKGLLRHAILFRREARSAENRARQDSARLALLQQFLQPSLTPSLKVAAYLSHGTEPSTLGLVSWLATQQVPILLPVLGSPTSPVEPTTPAEPTTPLEPSTPAETTTPLEPVETSAEHDPPQSLEPDWARYEGPDRLQSGRFSILQPTSPSLGAETLSQADLIICPGLAGSPSGQRLGRGGGWYDRALTSADPRTPVCLLLNDEEIIDELPVHSWDRPVDVIITPTRVIECSNR